MGEPKLSLELSTGNRLGGVALAELASAGVDPLVVVVRADDSLDWLPPPPSGGDGWRTASCFTSSLGLSFSLRCGLNAVLPQAPDAVLVALADQPFIRSGELRRLVQCTRERPELQFAASGNDGSPMPPCVFSKSLFPELERLDGDRGARNIFESKDYKGVVLEVESPNYFADADTASEFEEVRRLWRERGKWDEPNAT
ncbi:NTP transferase domain-containing protein [Paenibacillus sp. TRM 82003]|nr:NTP transferase domain-containing protein [Paenibacillus sp. TRM 82003]